jgi:hypothetical protein
MADLFSGLTLATGLARFVPAVLVLIILYGILGFTKALGDNKFVHAMISFCVALLALVSYRASEVIAILTPWFVILFIFIIFVLIAFKSMGVSDSQILSAMGEYKAIVWWVVAVSLIIGVISLTNVFGQTMLEQQSGFEEGYIENVDGTYTLSDGRIVNAPTGGLSSATSNFRNNATRTIFHPRVLGFALIGIISAFTIFFMTRLS